MVGRPQNTSLSMQEGRPGRGSTMGLQRRLDTMTSPFHVSIYSRFLTNLASHTWVFHSKYNEVSLKASCISLHNLPFWPPGNMLATYAQMIVHLWGFSRGNIAKVTSGYHNHPTSTVSLEPGIISKSGWWQGYSILGHPHHRHWLWR